MLFESVNEWRNICRLLVRRRHCLTPRSTNRPAGRQQFSLYSVDAAARLSIYWQRDMSCQLNHHHIDRWRQLGNYRHPPHDPSIYPHFVPPPPSLPASFGRSVVVVLPLPNIPMDFIDATVYSSRFALSNVSY